MARKILRAPEKNNFQMRVEHESGFFYLYEIKGHTEPNAWKLSGKTGDAGGGFHQAIPDQYLGTVLVHPGIMRTLPARCESHLDAQCEAGRGPGNLCGVHGTSQLFFGGSGRPFATRGALHALGDLGHAQVLLHQVVRLLRLAGANGAIESRGASRRTRGGRWNVPRSCGGCRRAPR